MQAKDTKQIKVVYLNSHNYAYSRVIEDATYATPPLSVICSNKTGKLIAEIWEKFSLTEIKKAKTIEGAKTALNNTHDSSKMQKVAEHKLNKFHLVRIGELTTEEELLSALENAPDGSKAEKLLLEKLSEL